MNKKLTHLASSKHTLTAGLLAVAACMFSTDANAQLSKNKDKFLGNITTRYQVDYGNEKYYTLWNQITCENESKWGSVEGTNNSFNWGSDNAYNYAKNHNFPFKFHALIWGAQYPKWLESQTPEQRYKEIVQWMDKVKEHYPNLQLIDVVNEAISGHQAGTPYFIEALGGTGRTGYDWLVKAFELAYERWPNAILIYNDFNTFQWNTDQYIDLVRALRDAGAPVDAYGCQSHDLTNFTGTNFKNVVDRIQNSLKMPMYITEYDIGTTNDDDQLKCYKEHIPYFWEADYCAGVTLWGYIYGTTWTTDGNSGIIKDGKDRPAMTWLREYMKSEKALNAKSPFPGMVKEASLYVQPGAPVAVKTEEFPINVRARLKTKTIDHIDVYVKGKLATTLTSADKKAKEDVYVAKYVPEATGKHDVKVVLVATDGTQWERLGAFEAAEPRSPYSAISLPGNLEAEKFDNGAEGIAYHDTDNKNEGGAAYRSNCGVDITRTSTGYAISHTKDGEWLEYSLTIKEAGLYSYDAFISSNVNTAAVKVEMKTEDGYVDVIPTLNIRSTGSFDTYKNIHGRTAIELPEGDHIFRISIVSGNCNIDRIKFTKINVSEDMKLTLAADPSPATINTNTTLTVDIATDTSTVKNVKYYVNDILYRTVTAAPYSTTYRPTAMGTYKISAYATDAYGNVSEIATYNLKANNKRAAFGTMTTIPGILQAENFDKGGEGFTFHDSDDIDEGKSGYRTDNEGVDIVAINGGYAITNTQKDEWYEYTVNVTDEGNYRYSATMCSAVTGSKFSIYDVQADTTVLLATIVVPQASSYRTLSGKCKAPLTAGQHTLRILITTAKCNIDKVEFKLDTTPIENIESDKNNGMNNIYNLAGQKVDGNYKGIIIRNGKKYIVK